METESSSPHSQEPASSPYPVSDRFFKIHFNTTLPSKRGLFPSVSATENLLTPLLSLIRVT